MAEPLLSCSAADLDSDPNLLGLTNGALELASCTFRTHRAKDRLTKLAGCGFEANATAPLFQRFLTEIMDNDLSKIEYLQRLVGYSLSGVRGDHILPIFWGSGANGKSTFLGVWQALLGDYAGTASPDLLVQTGRNEHPTVLAELQGRRLVVASESANTADLNEDRVKWLTGGDLISARRMHQDPFQFSPSHLLVLQTNYVPRVKGVDEGLWRRLQLVPFGVTISSGRRDSSLKEKLLGELPGILNWAIAGWKAYKVHGLAPPPAICAATQRYRGKNGDVEAYIQESCVLETHAKVSAGDLYENYTRWCSVMETIALTKQAFGRRLTARGMEKYRSSGTHRWRGLKIGRQ